MTYWKGDANSILSNERNSLGTRNWKHFPTADSAAGTFAYLLKGEENRTE